MTEYRVVHGLPLVTPPESPSPRSLYGTVPADPPAEGTPAQREAIDAARLEREFSHRKPAELQIIPTLSRGELYAGRTAEEMIALGAVEPTEGPAAAGEAVPPVEVEAEPVGLDAWAAALRERRADV